MQTFFLILCVINALKLRFSLERLERLLVFDKLITDKKVRLSKFLYGLKADKISQPVSQFHPFPATNTVLSSPFKSKPSPKETMFPRELSLIKFCVPEFTFANNIFSNGSLRWIEHHRFDFLYFAIEVNLFTRWLRPASQSPSDWNSSNIYDPLTWPRIFKGLSFLECFLLISWNVRWLLLSRSSIIVIIALEIT